MQAPSSVYPTAPPGMQVQVPEGGTPTDGGDQAEQSKSPLTKVKNKAKKLRDKFKKVTSPSTPTNEDLGAVNEQNRAERGNAGLSSTPPQHQSDDGEDDAEASEEDEEDHPPVAQDQSTYDQPRGAAFKSGDDAENVMHGGVPAPTGSSSAPGGPQKSIPISPFKSDGPPGTLQAAPTEYHYPPEGEQISEGGPVHGGVPAPTFSASVPQEDSPITPYKSDGPPDALQATPTEYHYPPEEEQISAGSLNDAPPGSKSRTDDEADLTPSPASEDVPSYTSRGDVAGTESAYEQSKPAPSNDPEAYTSSETPGVTPYQTPHQETSTSDKVSEGALDVSHPDDVLKPDNVSAGQMSPTERDMNVPYPSDLVKPNPEFGRSASPMRNKIGVINEDLPAEARTDAGLSPDGYSSPQGISDVTVPEHAPLMFDKKETDEVDVPKGGPELGGIAREHTPSNVDDQEQYASGDRSDYQSPGKYGDASSRDFGGIGKAEPLTSASKSPEAEIPEDPRNISGTSERQSGEQLGKAAAATKLQGVDEPLNAQAVPLPSDASQFDREIPTSDSTVGPEVEGSSGSDRQPRDVGVFATAAGATVPLAAAAADASYDRSGDQYKDSEANPASVDSGDKCPNLATGGSTTDDFTKSRKTEGVLDVASDERKQQLPEEQVPLEEYGRSSGRREEESQGKWEADKLSEPKEAVTTSDYTSLGQDNVAKGADDYTGTPDATERASPYGQEDFSKQSELLEGNQFQEGYKPGNENADKESSDESFTNSATGKLAGLTAAAAASLGLADASAGTDAPSAKDTEKVDLTDAAANPPSPAVRNETTAADEGKDIPSRGRGLEEKLSEKAGMGDDDTLNTRDKSNLADQQPSGGSLGSLKNFAASKLGYGSSRQEGLDSPPGVVSPGQQPPASATDGGEYIPSQGREVEKKPNEEVGNVQSNLADQQPAGGSFGSLKNFAASKLGYGSSRQEGFDSPPGGAQRGQQPPATATDGGEGIPSQGRGLEEKPFEEVGTGDVDTLKTGDKNSEENVQSNVADQQPAGGGSLESVKNFAASKLGYGSSRQEGFDGPPGGALLGQQPPSAAAPGEQAPYALEEKSRPDDRNLQSDAPGQPQPEGTFQGLKNAAASKLNYGMQTSEDRSPDVHLDERSDYSHEDKQPPREAEPPVRREDWVDNQSSPLEATAEPEAKSSDAPSSYSPSSYAQKFFSTAAAAKDYLWSPKPSTESQEAAADESRNINNAEVQQ